MSSIDTSNIIRQKQNENVLNDRFNSDHLNKFNDSNFSLKFLHWNSNLIKNKIKEFKHFINIVSPSIISLNETKLNKDSAKSSLELTTTSRATSIGLKKI